MLNPEEIRAQISEIRRTISKLNVEMEKWNKEKNKAEDILAKFSLLPQKITTGIDDFENCITKKTATIEGNFGDYYKRKVSGAIKKGKVRNLEYEASNMISSLKTKILNIDDVIADYVRQISEKKSILESLKSMLDSVLEAIDDAF